MIEEEKISIIIPAYNASKTIFKCLTSILEGDYKNIEIIVINDGSTDNTQEIVSTYQQTDSRIILINQTNHGAGYARCAGVHKCTGDYIAFCDADDWYDQNYLLEHYKHIVEFDADISQCKTLATTSADSESTGKTEIIDKDLMGRYITYQSINVTLWDKLYRRELLDTDEIDNDCRYSEDLYMNYIASKRAKRIVKFDTAKYNWYYNPDSLTKSTFKPQKLSNDFWVWDKIIQDCNTYYPELVKSARLSSILWICGTYRTMVNSHYHNKESELKIANYIRQFDSKLILQATKNRANRFFIRLTLFSMPLARYIWYGISFLKSCAKKNLKRAK